MTDKKTEALKLALEALEVASSCVDGYYIPKGKTQLPEVESAITAIREALNQPEHSPDCALLKIPSKDCDCQPEQEPVAWVDLIKEADEIVRGKVLWKRFIDGTPLANDIAVWMADFAQKHTSPPASKQWVGLTYGEVLEQKKDDPIQFYRAIEAKLKEKNA